MTAGEPARRLEENVTSHAHSVPDGSGGRGRHCEAAATHSIGGSAAAEHSEIIELDLTTETVEKRYHQLARVNRPSGARGTGLEQEVIILDPDEIEEERTANAVISACVRDSFSSAELGSVEGHNQDSCPQSGHHRGGSGCGQLLASPVSVATATGNHGTTSIVPVDLHSPFPLKNRTERSEPPLPQREQDTGLHGGSVLEGSPTGTSIRGDGTVEEVDGGRLFVQALSRAGAGGAVVGKAGGGRSGGEAMREGGPEEYDESFPEFDDIVGDFGSCEDFLSQVQPSSAHVISCTSDPWSLCWVCCVLLKEYVIHIKQFCWLMNCVSVECSTHTHTHTHTHTPPTHTTYTHMNIHVYSLIPRTALAQMMM